MDLDHSNFGPHNSSPAPETYQDHEAEYSAYQAEHHTTPRPVQPRPAFASLHNSHHHSAPSPLGQAYNSQPASSHAPQQGPKLHPLLSISDLVPNEARPHLVRAGNRAEQKKDEGGNKWETCELEEWQRGGEELVDKTGELIKRMMRVMV